MSGEKSLFLSLKKKKGGRVTIGDNKTLPILGKGTIGNSIISINKVQYVKGLTYNLLSICLLYTSPSPRDGATSRMPSSA